MSETKVKCPGCVARAEKIKQSSIRIWRKTQSLMKPIRKR